MISRAIIPTRHLVKSLKNTKNIKKEKIKNTKQPTNTNKSTKVKKQVVTYDKIKEDRDIFLL